MTFSSSRSRRSKYSTDGPYEFYEMKEITPRRQENRLFDRDPRHTIKMNRYKREALNNNRKPLTLTEELSIDVQVLNHCFSDIEQFVGRLQACAESNRELERPKKWFGKNRDHESIYSSFGHRTRTPHPRDFTDIFQKMKLSINLLAKLKPYISAPNSPELVHFLFTPLSLIFDASREPNIRHLNLSQSAIAPLLTKSSKELLTNCLTSKEMELWRILGKNWTSTSEEWKVLLPFYTPKFYDGWEPSPGRPGSGLGLQRDLRTVVLAKAAESKYLFDKELSMKKSECPSENSTIYCRINDSHGLAYSNSFKDPVLPTPELIIDKPLDDNPHDTSMVDVHLFDDAFVDERPSDTKTPEETQTTPTRCETATTMEKETAYVNKEVIETQMSLPADYNIFTFERGVQISEISPSIPNKPSVSSDRVVKLDETSSSGSDDGKNGPYIVDSDSADFMQKLKNQDIKACVVIHDREAGNTKELSLKQGDVVGLIDNTKNWWKVKNSKGVIGFAPFTILKVLKDNDDRIAFKF